MVHTGPPGIGKSTYISNLYRELRDAGIPAIRHHFFLSLNDPTRFRCDHQRVAASLMSELQGLFYTHDCGRRLSERGEKLVVILDGLDHVWSDAGSVEELNRLFQLITPVSPGVILLIGTQPVDNSRLPRHLSEFAPRDTWKDLPALEYPAVRSWAEFHASNLRALRNDEAESHVLDDLAEALWRKSEGRPLHLRYFLKSLEDIKGFIIPSEIERLPKTPHKDIAEYYSRFWEDVPDESRQVLSLLATCDSRWSRMAIAECLDPHSRNLTIDSAIRKVAHLTDEDRFGLQFAHTVDEATAAIRNAEAGTGRHLPIFAMTARVMTGDADR